ncbi:MAG: response regulator [bacterium]|nr:response regulator [bacterium]
MSIKTSCEREQGRLRALRSFEILDTDAESTFDDFTSLVAQLFDVPVALISLVDERRQWFKSVVGLDTRETARDIAFCDTAIRSDEVMVVRDATSDERFRDNPLVTDEPRIRFYAGAPLISTEGQAIGTLCAIDTRPRQLSGAESKILQILARQVMAQLELRRVTIKTLREEAERHELESKLQESQRMDSLAVLAGGIAHDFNNLLTGVLGNAELARLLLPAESPAIESIAQIKSAAQQAADLTKQMLAYSGEGLRDDCLLDLTSLVEETGHLMKATIGPNTALAIERPTDSGSGKASCSGNPVQLRQVLMNLIVNSSDAIGDADGTIHIRTGCQAVTSDYLANTLLGDRLSPGSYAFVEVEDTGVGMSEDTRSRMFDPFFSTKTKGRGLGLAATLGILRSHGGTAMVRSTAGAGTTVRVLLPIVEDDERSTPDGLPKRGGGEVVLVVDDEHEVRSVATRMLEESGFRVQSAASGRDALARFESDRESIDLVLTDLTMPDVDGAALLQAIRQRAPDTPVVLMSGHAEERLATELASRGWSGFLQKPFTAEGLVNRLVSAIRA